MKQVGRFCERCGAAVGRRDAFCEKCKAEYYAVWKLAVPGR